MIAQLDSRYLRIRPWKVWARLVSYALFEGRPVTTRGRWINPLVFTLSAAAKSLPCLKKVRKPVFIVGTGRSGTTVLGVVLSMHRDVGFLNEPKALWHAIHSGEDLIGSYSRNLARYRLPASAATPKRVRDAHRLFGAYLTATFSHRVVDKYPELIFRVQFAKAIFPDAKFLFLVRNGWDTCHSIDQWSTRLGKQLAGETHDWWGVNQRKWMLLVDQLVPEHEDLAPHADTMRSWTRHSDMAAVEWVVTMREGLELLQRFPDQVLRVTYEDLCSAPQEILTRIVHFVELDDDQRFFRYGKKTLRPTAAKKPVPLDPAILEPFRNTMEALGYEQQ
jgi:hypothetical protein